MTQEMTGNCFIITGNTEKVLLKTDEHCIYFIVTCSDWFALERHRVPALIRKPILEFENLFPVFSNSGRV